MAVITMICNMTTLSSPVLVALFCPDETPSQWARMFFILAIVITVLNIPFVFVVSTKPAEWTKSDWNKYEKPQSIKKAEIKV